MGSSLAGARQGLRLDDPTGPFRPWNRRISAPPGTPSAGSLESLCLSFPGCSPGSMLPAARKGQQGFVGSSEEDLRRAWGEASCPRTCCWLLTGSKAGPMPHAGQAVWPGPAPRCFRTTRNASSSGQHLPLRLLSKPTGQVQHRLAPSGSPSFPGDPLLPPVVLQGLPTATGVASQWLSPCSVSH